ncbi:hypothetical protein M433DRAFT_574 [Acidomyces richmondensis BFW]|nr:hypothetical protein M433DRAFT_574 [Acidomyces richmondensis BFW]
MVDDFGQRWVVAPAPTAAHSTTERHVSNDANQDDDGAVPDYADEFSNIDKPVESDSVNGDDAGRENGDLRYGQFRNTMRELCAAWHVTSGLEMENGMSLDNQDAVFPQFSSRGSDNTTISLETRDRWPLPRYKNLSYYAGDKGRVEHIAGPGRLNQDGYSGHRITLEEMRGCITSQCLVRKPAELSLLPYKFTLKDAAFERWGCRMYVRAKEIKVTDHSDHKAREHVREYVRIVTEEIAQLTDAINDALAALKKKAGKGAGYAAQALIIRPDHVPHDKPNWFALYTFVKRQMRLGKLK